MRVYLTSDHAGVDLKEAIYHHLRNQNIEVFDLGPNTYESVDYPDFAHSLARCLGRQDLDYCGIAICGTGNGMAMTLNKYPNIRAGLVWNTDIARLVKEHNNSNVLVLPARYMAIPNGLECVDVWLASKFQGGRHSTRVNKIPYRETKD